MIEECDRGTSMIHLVVMIKLYSLLPHFRSNERYISFNRVGETCDCDGGIYIMKWLNGISGSVTAAKAGADADAAEI